MSVALQSARLSVPGIPPRPDHGGFFDHHGIWAPGVRLFRRLPFAAKTMIMAAVFSLPLLGLLAWQMSELSDQALRSRLDATRQHVEIAHGVVACCVGRILGGWSWAGQVGDRSWRCRSWRERPSAQSGVC